MSAFSSQQPVGLYVHIPFCRKKCAYCDFFSITEGALKAPFLSAVKEEADMRLPTQEWRADSLYIGGGTPSVMREDYICRIIEQINRNVSFCTDNEITVEVNPESTGTDWLGSVRRAGVNRVSIGVQSFNDTSLAFLGRIHTARQARQAFDAARKAGFDNISLDIIYGLPGQTLAGLEQDLSRVMALEPEHISCYMLTIEPGTPLAWSLKNKQFHPLSESVLGEMFLMVSGMLPQNGYGQYEISNFSRTIQNRSRHNIKYWKRIDYLGLGPSAHSCLGAERSWNVDNVPKYVDRLAAGRMPQLSGEKLSRHQQMTEAVYLGLRLAEGVDIDAFNREFSDNFKALFAPALSAYEQTGKLFLSNGQCRLSTRGMLFHETIAADLTALIP